MNEHVEISVAKALAGEASQEELAEIAVWRAANAENETAYQEFKKAWEIAQDGSSFVPDTDSAWERMNQRIESDTPVISIAPQEEPASGKKTSLKSILAAAAAILVLIGTVALPYVVNGDAPIEEVAVNEMKEVQLADGTTVWLNQQSSIQYPEVFAEDNRTVVLQGEAFFEVAKNPNKPFIIKTELTETKVLGTSFNLRAYPNEDEVSVSVSTGTVSFVDLREGAEPVILNAGDEGIYNNEFYTLSTTKPDVNVTSWKTGMLKFDNTSFEKVKTDLEHCYGIKIKFDNEAMLNCKITDDFNSFSLNEVLDVVSATLGLSYEIDGDVVSLEGSGCPAD